MKSLEPRWIGAHETLSIHSRLLSIHGGAPGLRDRALLESALARPRQHAAYSKSTGIPEMAALYTAGIVRNHPFVDGNKRVGFLIGALFLELNGFDFHADEADSTQAVFGLASGVVSETAYAEWLKSNCRKKS
jgi:death-on-curing protein